MSAMQEDFEKHIMSKPMWQYITQYDVWRIASKIMKDRCADVCAARYMGDNNREDMEARRCADAIRSINIDA